MIKMLVPWQDVAPWAQVVEPGAGQTWTVQPFYPTGVKLLRNGSATRYLTPRPLDLVTVLVPDASEAVAMLRAVFTGAELLATNIAPAGAAEFWSIPAPDPRRPNWLGEHMRDWHHIQDVRYWRLPAYEYERFHLACHQQAAAYPLAVAHTHAEWSGST